jgi:2-polyprenyl-3-methyl-5-hydroxy-6-metoxy-1,4-benzoquinol methylase
VHRNHAVVKSAAVVGFAVAMTLGLALRTGGLRGRSPPSSDLDAYAAMVEEFGVRSILDLGCGTGTLACLLARRGLTVTAVDPAQASLAVARTKPGADRVR